MRQNLVPNEEPIFVNGELVVDLAHRSVRLGGEEIKLSPTEYAILRMLVLNAGKVVTHRQLLHQVWGPAYVDEAHYVRVYMGLLRQKIERVPARPQFILSEPGVGYRLRVSE